MTPDSFIAALRVDVRDSAVDGCIGQYESPAGRRPPSALLELSNWFNGLPAKDRVMVERVARDVAGATVFGFLTVLDGDRVIEAGPDKGELRLVYVKPPIEQVLNDPDEEALHDRWNAT